MMVAIVLFATAFLGRSPFGVAREEPTDLIKPRSAWKGQIRQGDSTFPATVHFSEREKDRVRGEVHFQGSDGWCQLTFQGNVIEGQHVAWITNRKAGNVTYPGLYIGKIEGKSITGVWQVPSAGQYDTFSVKLAD
jgi:hypothetical protein